MNSLRIASRAALRARPAAIRAPLQRRGYAEAVNDKARALWDMLNFATRIRTKERNEKPRRLITASTSQSLYKSQDVVQVNLPAESGDMGILANHVPSIEQLKPGLVEIIEESGSNKQYFLSGGFAVVQPNSALSINAVEAYPLEDFSAEAVRSQIVEAQKVASGSGSEQDIAEAKIELEASSMPVLETLQASLK
ncbi:delta subunit of the central stalk of mitochondrial F1F0 ATP synthase, atp16 [Cytospora paraplurivora]|uniref:ATP synthase subunit delta, mitochondrial n=1 Tax=Cytospora paraplurivora TaxID=2898453 RepID=A0AAN9YDM8_9PEZI